MATSGSLTTSKYDGRYYKLAWERTSYSTANNTSTIKWTLSAHGGDASWYAERTLEVKIAGKTVKSKTSSVNRYTGEIDSGTLTISHNTDGTKSFTASVRAAVYYSSVNCTGSKTFTLTAIPRESTVSATSANVGQDTTITISRKVSSYTHTLAWECNGIGGTIATKTSSTSVKFTLPDSLYAKIGASKTEVDVIIGCTTYNGSSQVGNTKTCTIKAKTTSARNGPTLSPTIATGADTQNLTGNSTTVISGYSSVAVTFNAAARNSATLSSQKCVNGSKSRTTDGAFANVVTKDFVFTATDSRGYSTSVTKSVTMINYIEPTCALKVQIGVDGKAEVNASGKFYNGSFGKVTNALNIQFRYKVSGGSYSAWTTFQSAAPSGNTWSANHTLTGLDYSKTYYFQARAIDQIPKTATSDEIKAKAMPVFDWGENDFQFNVPMSAPNLGRDVYNIKDYIDTSVTGKVNSDGISGYFYILKPFNLVYVRISVTDFTSATDASTTAITAIKFKSEFAPPAATALACYGAKNTGALMNTEGALRLIPYTGLTTASDLYISGVYPLSADSSLFI